MSHFATADSLTASPADSMKFEEQAVSPQALPLEADPSQSLNSTTVNPSQQIQPGMQAPAAGTPLVYQMPKAPAKNKDDGKNPMDQIMQMMNGGGGAGAGGKSTNRYGTPSQQAATEGTYNAPYVCEDCAKGIRNGSLNQIDLGKAADFSNIYGNPNMTEKEKCYAEYTAKEVVKQLGNTRWKNNNSSGGQCARGVRTLLDLSGLKKKGQGLMNAIDYHGRQTLKPLGYRLLTGVTEENAPQGSILVYKGPESDRYLKNSRYNDGTGNTLGHVTIKGADNAFYTDGRTLRGAGPSRKLVGVWIMSTCDQCEPAVKAKCDGAGGK